jgi:hypothetical protein
MREELEICPECKQRTVPLEPDKECGPGYNATCTDPECGYSEFIEELS